MARETPSWAVYVLDFLRRKGRQSAPAVVAALLQKFKDLDEETAGDIVWKLIDSHKIRVTDEADLEANDAIAASS
jgi:hypothetical protein